MVAINTIMRHTRTNADYENVMTLLKTENMKKVSEITGIPWSTIKNWKSGRSVSNATRYGMNVKDTFTNRIRNTSREELQSIANSSTSLSDMLKKFNVDYSKPFYLNMLRGVIESLGVDLTMMSRNKRKSIELSHDEIFTSNSIFDRATIRRHVVRHNLIEYKCFECGLTGEYNGKPLSLQLDHVNGIRNDHRKENLRWLCPNCHSQQETSFGKKR